MSADSIQAVLHHFDEVFENSTGFLLLQATIKFPGSNKAQLLTGRAQKSKPPPCSNFCTRKASSEAMPGSCS